MGKEAKTTRLQRIRIFSAGVISNFIVAIIAFSIFFYLLGFLTPLVTVEKVVKDSPAYGVVEEKSVILSINGKPVRTVEDVSKALKGYDSIVLKLRTEKGIKEVTLPKEAGIRIAKLYEGYPAAKAGLKEGMIIFKVNNIETPTLTDFRNVLGKTKPGDTVTIHAYYNGTVKEFRVTLAASPYGDSGFLGIRVEEYISGIIPGYSELILDMLKSIPYLLGLPFYNFRGFGADALNYFEITGFWSYTGNTIFYLLNIFFWVGWINFYVGLFNCLPAIPLDGGRVFHEAFSALLSRKYGEKGEEMSFKAVKLLAFIVFSSIVLSVVIPNVQGLLK
jgi:membrane-associated protease RseP (regulator of RpoE activity)